MIFQIVKRLKETVSLCVFANIRGMLHIPVNPATDSGVIRPLVRVKRRCSFIISPCGRNESREIYVFS